MLAEIKWICNHALGRYLGLFSGPLEVVARVQNAECTWLERTVIVVTERGKVSRCAHAYRKYAAVRPLGRRYMHPRDWGNSVAPTSPFTSPFPACEPKRLALLP